MIDPDDKRLRYVPLDKATVPPPGLIEHIKDSWWSVHPERGLIFFKDSPQCNQNEAVSRHISSGHYPWAEVQFIPSVFRTINPQDYV